MLDNMMGYTSPINDPGLSERILDASPNTGRVLAGSANSVTLYKKLRKKEDDMHNHPTERVVRPVSDSEKDTAISRKDAKEDNHSKETGKKQFSTEAVLTEEETYEPFIGILVDYTA